MEKVPNPGSSLNCLVMNEFSGHRNAKRAKPTLVALLGPGEIFGEYEAFKDRPIHEFTLVC